MGHMSWGFVPTHAKLRGAVLLDCSIRINLSHAKVEENVSIRLTLSSISQLLLRVTFKVRGVSKTRERGEFRDGFTITRSPLL